MCGICGVFNIDGDRADGRLAEAMSARLEHRGPDDAGLWTQGPVAFGFRRLSILDLEGGHQPMSSVDGRLTIVFNGEIYNHLALRRELEAEGARYRTRSDTETILHLYRRDGIEAFKALNGMFAVGLWDALRRELVLARDPIGVKPLYYAIEGDRLAFASELRALTAAGVSDALDPGALLEYLSYGCVHSPRTALTRALKLPPGHLLRVDARGLKLERYWDIPAQPAAGRPMLLEEAEERLERLLTDSVRGQLLSDVPVGAFLSGGVDSSLVAALMAGETGAKVRTFTIGFSGARPSLDESEPARLVARYLGTDHHELVLPADVLDRLDELALCLDEPIADSAILPTFLLARFARESVKVVLTGEGADELFAGYNRYKASYLSEALSRLPPWGRGFAAPMARRMGKGRLFKQLPLAAVRDWAEATAHSRPEELSAVCLDEFLGSARRPDPMGGSEDGGEPHSLNAVLAYDLRTTLCDSLLMKVDKATMRASLEARVPFLDKEVVAFAARLPSSIKMRRLKGKFILRRLAAKRLPSSIAWRRKHGFVVPWEEWVRRPNNPVVDDLVSAGALPGQGVFDADRLRAMRSELKAGSRRVDAGLFFRVLVLGMWFHSLKKGGIC